ncbi:MAG: dihydropteroate synthase [Pseudomonadota bacterium]
MGILNVTPDSFSDGGKYLTPEAAVRKALALVDAGAEIIDIGGESTRPGAETIPEAEELDRVCPVIDALVQETDIPISIDTRKPAVAKSAIKAGASIWNDVSALTYAEESLPLAASLQCPIVLMHAKGTPKSMQVSPAYDDVLGEIVAFLEERIQACIDTGIDRRRIIVDPGIGFGKTLAHNLCILRNIDVFKRLAPVLLGASRKRFIGLVDRETPAEERQGGSIAAALIGASAGVDIIRVHDVAQTRQALAVWSAVARSDTH